MSPIFVALDTPDVHHAASLARQLIGVAGGVKLGLEFFCANGHEGVLRIAQHELPVFLDLKLHDIPNTVGKAVSALAPLDPAILTVHAAGGKEMMTAAKQAAPSHTKVVAVTVLTSLDQDDLASTGISGSPAEQVERLTELAREAGLDGIVCSGAEVALARKQWPEGFFVVPGVRPAGGDVSDQKRVVTPAEAIDDGASILVIGRPITEANDPGQALREIAGSLKKEVTQ
jgi:orotidine-5'-phosphate decarboxylase